MLSHPVTSIEQVLQYDPVSVQSFGSHFLCFLIVFSYFIVPLEKQGTDAFIVPKNVFFF